MSAIQSASATALSSRGHAASSSARPRSSASNVAREAVLQAIIKAAPKVGNSPAGVRDLAEAYASSSEI